MIAFLPLLAMIAGEVGAAAHNPAPDAVTSPTKVLLRIAALQSSPNGETETEHGTVRVGELIPIQVTETNASDGTIQLGGHPPSAYGAGFAFEVRDSSGKLVAPEREELGPCKIGETNCPRGPLLMDGYVKLLEPGESFTRHLFLKRTHDLVPGEYVVQLIRKDDKGLEKSNTISLTVTP